LLFLLVPTTSDAAVYSFGGIFNFDQVGVMFQDETQTGSELPQYAAYLDHPNAFSRYSLLDALV
jgi:hypothetical protein